MLNYNIKIGLIPMRRNTTDRPRGTFLTWYSAEQRGERFVKYIEKTFSSEKVSFVDSNGSGDVFHGAFAAGVIKNYDYLKCCHFASAASAIKCKGIGARENAPDFETLKSFLKENGYEL